MSSEMRVTDEQVWAAVCAWRDVYDAEYMHSGSTRGNDEQAMRAALEAALLARTEAGADGAGVPFCPNCGTCDVVTRPQDASGDADEVVCEHSGCGYGPQANQVPVTLWPGDKVLMRRGRLGSAMQAKEAK